MEWHKRFVQQAAWTSEIRLYLFKRAGMQAAKRVLEVGCGTGAILSGLATQAVMHGLDKDQARLSEASHNAPKANLACADALALPYASGIFDITFCHFLLLWVGDPFLALREMDPYWHWLSRITGPGWTNRTNWLSWDAGRLNPCGDRARIRLLESGYPSCSGRRASGRLKRAGCIWMESLCPGRSIGSWNGRYWKPIWRVWCLWRKSNG
jgi:SAM-dependent methyltransferase